MRKHYVFGYGSLIDDFSRTLTVPEARSHRPAYADGFQRGWWLSSVQGKSPVTYVATSRKRGSQVNGVLFEIEESALTALDQRESSYQRESLECSQIRFLREPLSSTVSSCYWIYTIPEPRQPSTLAPIPQSYIDTCLAGCLKIDDHYQLPTQGSFARAFIQQTQGWNHPVENDRLNPRRPNKTESFWERIDSLATP